MPKKFINQARTADLDPFAFYTGLRLLFLKIGLLKLQRILTFYVDGFRGMKLGRTLWTIILIKLLIMFGVLKLFFFPDFLHENFSNDLERADHVSSTLTHIPTQE